jgi:hypothetical protein
MHYMVPFIFYTHNFVIEEVLHYIKELYNFYHKWIKNTLRSFSHGLINFCECPTQEYSWIFSTSGLNVPWNTTSPTKHYYGFEYCYVRLPQL